MSSPSCGVYREPGLTTDARDSASRSKRRPLSLHVIAAFLLITVFIASRIALLVTSYDANQNWEEPVFLFSSTELARDGLAHVFEHQDDLNHGGSIPLFMLAVPWVETVGTGLVSLKGIAILWSTATLAAFLIVAWRYFSPRIALIWGTCFVALSPTLARINVTLVGSHPEALLPCALALGAYLEWVRRRRMSSGEGRLLAAALGVSCGLAVWMSYTAVALVAPLLILRTLYARRPGPVAAVALGCIAGFGPWLYQNAWLRPHGALLWTAHLASTNPTTTVITQRLASALDELAASFGYGAFGGWLTLSVCVLGLAMATAALFLPDGRAASRVDPLAVAPLVAASVLGLLLILAARIPVAPAEGYYHYRFYVPLQVALFWTLALAIDRLGSVVGWAPIALAGVAALIAAATSDAHLFGQGNHYEPDFHRDRDLGCHVFGVAESDRSPDWATAIERLAALQDPDCRERAFGGLGWGIGGRWAENRDVDAARTALRTISDPRLRSRACGGFAFVVSRTSDAALTPDDRADALKQIASVCR